MKLSLGLTPRDYSIAGGAVAYDADAQAYFTANTAITSAADKNAINDFYLGLKTDGIYTKIKAMYLPIWGSAASCKWNLINNRTFDLTFSVGGITYTSGGIQGNGTTGYANTSLNPSVSLTLTLDNTHLSFYSRTNIEDTAADIGNKFTSGNQFLITLRYTGFGIISDCYNSATGRIVAANTDSKGFYIQSRTASNVHKTFKNNSQIGTTNTGSSGSFLNLNLYLLSVNNNGTAESYSTRQCSFSSIGNGLTDSEASNFYTRVNTLMTYFGINV